MNKTVNVYSKNDIVKLYNLSRTIPERVRLNYARRILGYTKAKTVMDAGFGTGLILVPLAKVAKPDQVIYGVDISKPMYRLVRKETVGFRNVILKVCGVHRLSSEFNNKFDVVHIKAITHIARSPEKLLNRLSKLVKPGGYFVIGKEYSQPEDNLEWILKYKGKLDNNLYAFYKEYFKKRKLMGIPFKKPKMPAGDYDVAVSYLLKRGYKYATEISNKDLRWKKRISFLELVKAMKIGTFTVFRKRVSSVQRKILARAMIDYLQRNKIDAKRYRFYKAELRAVLLKKFSENRT